ncbi:hypothetical protein Syun_004680 [Stephania yunnanensis]|uniref:Uncharacterized protein n=1 Tax=Stephania yunnanensis TaxID=152371 RepID=A0AAP0Q1H8_9MAGN
MLRQDEAWRRYLQRLGERGLRAKSRQSTENRNTEVEGPGMDLEARRWFRVFVTTQERLAPERRRERPVPHRSNRWMMRRVYLNVAGLSLGGRLGGYGGYSGGDELGGGYGGFGRCILTGCCPQMENQKCFKAAF